MEGMKQSTVSVTKKIRKEIIKMHRKGPHIGSSLSAVDILAVLYFDIMRIPSLSSPNRDRFILSKGHAVSALYATLMAKGYLRKTSLRQYIKSGTSFYGHPVRGSVPGIEASTGSLGHGLSIGVGMAIAAKYDKKKFRIFVLMGDGECQEGSVWEGAMQASRLKLDNIIAIIDANNLQGYDRVDNIQPISTLVKKFKAFGWSVHRVDGHDIGELKEALKSAPTERDKPTAIIAYTVKGKGVSKMENQLGSHYFSVSEDELDSFISELD